MVTSAVKETKTRAEALRRGRELVRNQAWGAAFAEFSAADREAPLESQDLLSLALIAHLLGRDADNVALLSRAHQSFLKDEEVKSAVRCAFWLGFSAMLNGDMAQAGGWLARARRLLDDCKQDNVEEGYLLLPVGYRSVQGGDAEGAYTAFSEAAAIGDRFGDADLVALGRQGQGRALIRKGEITRGRGGSGTRVIAPRVSTQVRTSSPARLAFSKLRFPSNVRIDDRPEIPGCRHHRKRPDHSGSCR